MQTPIKVLHDLTVVSEVNLRLRQIGALVEPIDHATQVTACFKLKNEVFFIQDGDGTILRAGRADGIR